MTLVDDYSALMRYRNEGLEKYGTTTATPARGPKGRLLFPSVKVRNDFRHHKKVGPLYVGLKAPVTEYAEQELIQSPKPLSILEIGPGGGELAHYLQDRYPSKISAYYALDRDPAVTGRFERLKSVEQAPSELDLIVAAEVVEHMTADQFCDALLLPLAAKCSKRATAIISTPNALGPGGIARDFSHVQNYPWYDLYAIMRLAFMRVDVIRSTSIWSPMTALGVLPRIAICAALGIDWCEQLVCVAHHPS